MVAKLFEYDINKQWYYENGFYLTSHITRLSKIIAHYKLYESIINLPGHIVECGVFKGASLIRFATFREILENTYSRKIIGFDVFGKFPRQDNINDIKFIESFENEAGLGIPVEELEKVFKHKSINNYELIQGDILESMPKYVLNHPELKIALLHVDVDVYQPTITILEYLFDKVVKNGVIIFDDYGTVEGETRAIDEYLTLNGIKKQIEKLPISSGPTYIRKT